MPYAHRPDDSLSWLDNVPEICSTSEQIREIHRQISPKYIIYRRHRRYVDCYCTSCMKRYEARLDCELLTPSDRELYDFAQAITDKVKIKEALIKGEAIVSDTRKSVTESVEKRFNQRFLTCPMCGAEATARSAGQSRRKMELKYNITVFKASEDGQKLYAVCGTFYTDLRRKKPEEPGNIHLNPAIEEKYVMELSAGSVRIAVCNYWYRCYEEVTAPKEPYEGRYLSVMHFDDRYIGLNEIDKTFLKYVRPYIPHIRKIAFLQICALYPSAEILCKSGFRCMIDDISWNLPYKRTIDLSGKKPAEIFRTDPNRAAEIVRYGAEHSDDPNILEKIKAYKMIIRQDSSVRFETAANIYDILLRYNINNCRKYTDLMSFTGLSCIKLFNYLNKLLQEYNTLNLSYVMSDYFDYINECRDLGYDIKSTQINKPKELKTAHERTSAALRARSDEIKAKKNAELNRKYSERYAELSERYAYGDSDYIIVVPDSVESIINEGKAQRNCVAGYADSHMKGKTTILFLRKAAAPDKSFGTLEIGTDKNKQSYFVQARAALNDVLPEEASKWLDRWLDMVNSSRNRKMVRVTA